MLKKQILAVLCLAVLLNLFGEYTILAATVSVPVTGWPLSFWQKPDTATDLTEGGTGVAITGDSAFVQNGYGALHIWVEKSLSNLNAQAVQQISAFTEGEKYRLTGKLYISSTSWGFGLYLGNTRLTMLRDIAAGGQWVNLDYTFTFTGSSKDLKLQVAQIGSLYADDLSLKRVIYEDGIISGYGEELLQNGDFEADFAPAGEVSALQAAEGDGTVQLTWVNPADTSLKTIQIYNGDTLMKEVDKTAAFAVIDGLENGVDYVLTVKTCTDRGILSQGVTVHVKPYKLLPLPKVIKDDEDNRVIGITEEMEYSLDEGQTWTVYDGVNLPDLTGDVTVWLRMYSGESGAQAPVQILYFTAGASDNDGIQVAKAAIKGNTFHFNGSLKQAGQTNVTLLLVRKGQDRRSLSSVLAVGEAKSDATGAFSFTIPLADARDGLLNDGEYTLYADSGLTDDITYDGLVFTSSETRKNAMDALWSAADLSTLFVNGAVYYDAYRSMGFPLEDYGVMTAGKEQTISNFKAFLSLIDKNASDAQDQAAAAFLEAYLMSVLSTVDADGAYQLLKKYGDGLCLKYSDTVTWETLTQPTSGAAVVWIASYMAGKTYTAAESLNQRFGEAYALYLINNATYGSIASVIYAQSGFLNLQGSAYDKYMAMKDGNDTKTEISKAIVLAKYSNPFASGSEVLSAIQAAIAGLSGTPSGGSGGSGGGGTAASDVTISGASFVQQTDTKPSSDVFSDLNNAAWAKESILYLYQKGIVKGYTDGTFGPERFVTREEFVAMLVGAFGLTDETATAAFDDVSAEQWYYRPVASAFFAGIAGGMDDGRFGIGENITREDLAVMAYRCMAKLHQTESVQSQTQPFTDESYISGYAKEAVAFMKQSGIINGYEDGSFGPKNSATRAETAKIICSVLNRGEGSK